MCCWCRPGRSLAMWRRKRSALPLSLLRPAEGTPAVPAAAAAVPVAVPAAVPAANGRRQCCKADWRATGQGRPGRNRINGKRACCLHSAGGRPFGFVREGSQERARFRNDGKMHPHPGKIVGQHGCIPVKYTSGYVKGKRISAGERR